MKRWLKWIIGAVAALLLVLALGLLWLLQTESGARFALDRALGATAGKLSIGSSEGKLAGPLVLHQVRWRDAGVDAQVGKVTLDVAILALLSKTAHVENLEASDIVVATATQPPQPASNEPFSLQPPLDIRVDRVLLERIAVSHDSQPVFDADSFSANAWWGSSGLVVKQLALRAKQGEVDLDADLQSFSDYRGNAKGRFRWQLDGTDYAGTLDFGNDGNSPRLSVALAQPIVLTASAASAGGGIALDQRDWDVRVQAPAFDPKLLLKDSTLKSLALDIAGKFSTKRGEFGGTVDIDQRRVLVGPAVYTLDATQLTIESLALRASDVRGELKLSGQVPLGEQAGSADLKLGWTDVLLPAELAGQELASQGQVDFAGNAEKYTVKGQLQLGQPGKPMDIALAVNGSSDIVHLREVRIEQKQQAKAGFLLASGDVLLKPVLGWKLDVQASQLDPGAFAPEWPGALNFTLASEGRSEEKGISATLKLDKLDGSLRQRPVSGTADLKIAPEFVVDGTLALASGQSNLAIQGRGGKNTTDAQIGFSIASLADVLPQAQGRVRGQFQLKGKWPALGLSGNLNGQNLVLEQNRATSLEVNVDVADIGAPRGNLELLATGVTAGGQQFDRVSLDGKGDRSAHELVLNARGDALSAQLQLRGALAGENWSGTLNQLKLALKDQPEWNLDAPASLSWQAGVAKLGDLCLVANGPKLCVAGNQAADGSAQGSYRIERLPLAMLAALASPDATFRLDGEINGEGDVRRSAKGELNGSARIASAQGRIAYPDRPEQALLQYDNLSLSATLAPQQQRITLQAQLSDNGRIDGNIAVDGAEQALSGQIQIALGSISFVELLSAEVVNVKGRVDGRINLSGTVAKPALSGTVGLDGFAAEIPEAGLKLVDGKVGVDIDGAGRIVVSGGVSSGKGRLNVSGNGGLADDAPLEVNIEGQDFLAADIPAAHVIVAPKLSVKRNAQGLYASGEVGMPKADIDLTKLPGGGAAKTSPDVIIVDADKVDSKDALPVTADITLRLGDDVKLKGFGLDGDLKGQLVVVERPGRQTIGRGEIRVGGTYKAYGQDLKIQTGRLLFAGTAIDNPGLDLKAVRELKEVTAGLRVQGTAQVPVLTVFSEPAMEQSEALSYLITGRPLSALKSGEGDLVGAAAQALGSATGDLLAKGIGARLGVDAGVSDNAALGGAALTVGKYLSPKLYLSYGVGIFTPGEVITLRYKLSRMWELEAQNATTENRAGLNYRLEK
ncbi:autotransporter secretion inner membrane protein TamB [Tahibacter aquaticus]|uniref:Autotransporter secretion inner membrane protein TamB n=1 Tax=Tahibacter aquaticus TaxID=520092 RepID=A0A4R6YTF8_9GAMM|nr:translocation/assembly module TamB domain-containing protein [Tahibacter aquaticus]TDR41679.1 autotransporter secretion inner membrane protein TamB [Tahibacter aquaticus]